MGVIDTNKMILACVLLSCTFQDKGVHGSKQPNLSSSPQSL